MSTTAQPVDTQLQILFHGLVTVEQAEKLLKQWGLEVISVSAYDDAPVFVVLVPDSELEKRKKELNAAPEVSDVRKAL